MFRDRVRSWLELSFSFRCILRLTEGKGNNQGATEGIETVLLYCNWCYPIFLALASPIHPKIVKLVSLCSQNSFNTLSTGCVSFCPWTLTQYAIINFTLLILNDISSCTDDTEMIWMPRYRFSRPELVLHLIPWGLILLLTCKLYIHNFPW